MLIIISKENWVKLMMSLKIHTFRVFLNLVSECPGDGLGLKACSLGWSLRARLAEGENQFPLFVHMYVCTCKLM